MKPRLIILSDLWGSRDNEWITFYIKSLSSYFEIKYYDCTKLGGVDSSVSEGEIHHQFVNGGIEDAVDNLLKLETNEVTVLAFSIGGTIAWKLGLKGLKIKQLVAVSATRLRYEKEVFNEKIYLFYGEEDVYKPEPVWCKEMKIKNFKILLKQDHVMYRSEVIASYICSIILNKSEKS